MSALAVAAMGISTSVAQPASMPALESAYAKALLDSPRWIDKAWGAWLAGRLEEDSLRAMLVGQLSQAVTFRDSEWNSEPRGYVQALFDALIVSGTKVSADAILPFVNCCRTEVLILLAREPGQNEEALLDLRSQPLHDGEWLLANNLLFHMESARFFAETLEEMRITHKFEVRDSEVGFGGGSGGGSWGCGIHPMPRGFPPIGIYQLTTSAQEGSVLAFPGPHNAYYRRTVVPTDKQVPWNSTGDRDRQPYRIEYLAGLLGSSISQLEPIFERTSSILWRDAPGMTAEAQSELESQAAAILEFVGHARSAGMASVSGMRLRIVPDVVDARQSSREPLPAISPKEIVLP